MSCHHQLEDTASFSLYHPAKFYPSKIVELAMRLFDSVLHSAPTCQWRVIIALLPLDIPWCLIMTSLVQRLACFLN
jgi:hypothetical protein